MPKYEKREYDDPAEGQICPEQDRLSLSRDSLRLGQDAALTARVRE
jgi:hypothetical protein